MKTRKELKEEYKQRKPQMGVFRIRNIKTDTVFIDSSIDIAAKQNRHLAQLKMGLHPNKELQKDWKEFSSEDFAFELVSEIEHQDEGQPDYKKEVELLQNMVMDELKADPSTRFYN